ncbi:MutS-related protein [Niabella beijingensis]|uniref:MutS-related protein n=1 Tax=Niabella beijingensis TaxID=2872700 RepID=UPI001CBBF8A5|nr:DNA mismatch repair protein [Niabella beijingensis]MBZ4189385.1 DNA mismatch repair protein [Niabella beijingensis]
MILRTDEQTMKDLGMFGKHDGSGIYDIYNRSHTRGGEALLEQLFRNPLSDKEAINRRSGIIEKLAASGIAFPFNVSLFDMAEKYLAHGAPDATKNTEGTLGEKELQNGVNAVIGLIRQTRAFIDRDDVRAIGPYTEEREKMEGLLSDPVFEPVLKSPDREKLSYGAVTAYDALFRLTERARVEELLKHIYYLDVCISVAGAASERKFVFPRALDKGVCELRLEGVYHPSLKAPVGNNIIMNVSRNVIFLTGANMAGKSTFLRSLSTALYLAHMGFPVAAEAMEFSVLDGIYTTVNLPDNLGIGASHFYAEVLRVKKMATELSSGKSFFILFDELFRGTNVKDALEATVAVINGFATRNNSLFIVSSHIVEAGPALETKKNIDFLYLPTRMNGYTPEYTYKLEQGITDDRHGMVIIRNEGILDLLKNGKKEE